MRPFRNPKLQLDAPRADERRRHGRLRTEEITCSLGEVVDLSASGMKVKHKGRLSVQMDDVVTVTLKCDTITLPAEARIVRLEKVGFRRHIFGLQFEDMSPDKRAKLTHLARIAADQRVLPT